MDRKKVFTYNEFINEGLSAKVYHYTYLRNLHSILKTNTMQTTSTLSSVTDYNKNNGKFFYISLTSSGYSDIGYGASLPKDQMVKIEFNGVKLNYNLKSKRVDYWNRPKDPKDSIYGDSAQNIGRDFYKFMSRQDELEDRIITDKPAIKNINKYITSISILVDKDSYQFKNIIDILQDCVKLSKELNIQMYIYDNQKAFDHNLKEQSIDLYKNVPNETEKEEVIFGQNRRPDIRVWSRILALIMYEEPINRESIINDLRNGSYVDDSYDKQDIINYIEEMLSKDRFDYLDYCHIDANRHDYPISGYVDSIESDIHNEKTDSNLYKQYTLSILTREMKKHNCKRFFEYVKYKLSIRSRYV